MHRHSLPCRVTSLSNGLSAVHQKVRANNHSPIVAGICRLSRRPVSLSKAGAGGWRDGKSEWALIVRSDRGVVVKFVPGTFFDRDAEGAVVAAAGIGDEIIGMAGR